MTSCCSLPSGTQGLAFMSTERKDDMKLQGLLDPAAHRLSQIILWLFAENREEKETRAIVLPSSAGTSHMTSSLFSHTKWMVLSLIY